MNDHKVIQQMSHDQSRTNSTIHKNDIESQEEKFIIFWNCDSDVGVTIFTYLRGKKYVGNIILHVDDIPIGRQDHYVPVDDFRDRYVMLETLNTFWCRIP